MRVFVYFPSSKDEAHIQHYCGEDAFSPGWDLEIEVFSEEHDFQTYQSDQSTIFSGAYIITVLQYVYMWLILQVCGRSEPTSTFGNSVPRT